MIRFNHIAPHFHSSDVVRSREFYERVLGFSLEYTDGEPAHYVVMCRDEVYVHLSRAGPHGLPQHSGAAFVTVADVESLWRRVAAYDGCVVAPLQVADYGDEVRFGVFIVRDPDGNLLRIGEPEPADSA